MEQKNDSAGQLDVLAGVHSPLEFLPVAYASKGRYSVTIA